MNEPLDKFGEFLVRNFRDKMLDDLEMLFAGAWKAPGVQNLQERLGAMSDDQREAIRDTAERLITTGMHGFLFAVQEDSDADGSIRLEVDGVEIAKTSDGLHGEIFTEDGWIERFSQYPQEAAANKSLRPIA